MQTESAQDAVVPSTAMKSADEHHFVPAVNPAMCALERAVEDVAASDVPVLILGESGTGKRSLARQVHRLSSRRAEPFHEIVCSKAATELTRDFHAGEILDNRLCTGTLFLEEIADLSQLYQSRLYNIFFDGNQGRTTRARLIASSRRNLEQEIKSGHFREDLYYRISSVCLRVPPLRHRKEDIAVLAEHFLNHYAPLFGRTKPSLSPRMLQFLLQHSWPGNVRELEDALKTIVAVGNERMAMAALRAIARGQRSRASEPETLSLKETARAASRQVERELILKVLSRTRWNRKRAAQELQISYKALLYKLKQIGLEDDSIALEDQR